MPGREGWAQTRGRDSVSPSDAGQSDTFPALASSGVGIQLTFKENECSVFHLGRSLG